MVESWVENRNVGCFWFMLFLLFKRESLLKYTLQFHLLKEMVGSPLRTTVFTVFFPKCISLYKINPGNGSAGQSFLKKI